MPFPPSYLAYRSVDNDSAAFVSHGLIHAIYSSTYEIIKVWAGAVRCGAVMHGEAAPQHTPRGIPSHAHEHAHAHAHVTSHDAHTSPYHQRLGISTQTILEQTCEFGVTIWHVFDIGSMRYDVCMSISHAKHVQ